MPEATDIQMQNYADQRIRVRAEQFRALLNALRDDKAAIDDEYERATKNPPVLGVWNDARTDGPPHLLQAGYSAQDVRVNPDDLGNFNSFISAIIAIIDGTGVDADNAAAIRSAWPVLNRACARGL